MYNIFERKKTFLKYYFIFFGQTEENTGIKQTERKKKKKIILAGEKGMFYQRTIHNISIDFENNVCMKDFRINNKV